MTIRSIGGKATRRNVEFQAEVEKKANTVQEAIEPTQGSLGT